MISLQTLHRGNAGKAGHYYADQKDDYYGKEGDAAQWQGQGARELGLQGVVTQEQFVDAMRGKLGDDIALSTSIRKDSKARAALDLTFSAPKSISIQALVGKDVKVLEAHDHAVTKTLEYLERELVRGRHKEDGVSYSEQTGNAIIAKFRHETARPTEFDEADPQLHTHSLIMNATKRSDGTWVSMSNEQVFKHKKLLDAVYKNEMASFLEKAGYSLRYENDNFELAHISRDQIEHFSKRGMQVQDELAKIGKDRKTASRELKQAITLATRNDKRPEITREALQASWEKDAHDLGINFDQDKGHRLDWGLGIKPPSSYAPVALECVKWAIHHISERDAVMTEEKLVQEAMAYAMGTGVKYWDIKRAIDDAVKQGHLIQGAPVYRLNGSDAGEAALSRQAWVDTMVRAGATPEEAHGNVRRAIATGGLVLAEVHYTTQAGREREKRILQIEREGRGVVTPLFDKEQLHGAFAGSSLQPGQLAAAELILTTENRVVGVQGLAGVGKSYMLEQVKTKIEDHGYTVKSIAPYSQQVKELRRLGVEAVTVASVLTQEQGRFDMDSKTVLVIDEAAVVPTRQMEKLQKRAEQAGARVVMMGDKDQTKAIEAGRPMHQLQDAGMHTARMADILRQEEPHLRKAVELAAEGAGSEAVHVLSTKLGAVHEIKDAEDRYKQIAQSFTQLSPQAQRETLIVTGTNQSRRALNALVHEQLGLAGTGFEYSLLTRVDTTQAQRRSARYYQVGQILQPERSYKMGLIADVQYIVRDVNTEKNRIIVESLDTGQKIEFNPTRATRLSVYDRIEQELSAGDMVRITRNHAKQDLANGERYTVMVATPTTVKLGQLDEHGKVTREVVLAGGTKSSPFHMDLAYATTAHSAQGLSETGAILNQETYSRTTKSDVFYVGISRARQWIRVYTDDMSKLPFAVSRKEDKAAALDIGLAQHTKVRDHTLVTPAVAPQTKSTPDHAMRM
ncbi:TrwC [Pusillimonas sp. T7-7]|uniref:MobF family relaxase n=1 Tax=Pusillimonas sp. (strain T7-7) TaxID=1007105 RepID=UPI0002084C32|nr:MobF family relaxase [Pusillimonas sp. T7-7]AEC18835.1 TrwC [Pusillimonas sp. T7-7]